MGKHTHTHTHCAWALTPLSGTRSIQDVVCMRASTSTNYTHRKRKTMCTLIIHLIILSSRSHSTIDSPVCAAGDTFSMFHLCKGHPRRPGGSACCYWSRCEAGAPPGCPGWSKRTIRSLPAGDARLALREPDLATAPEKARLPKRPWLVVVSAC